MKTVSPGEMSHHRCIPVAWRLLLALLIACPLLARDDAAIREVAEGKRTEARADWWGFDEKDATAALQAAIKSAAKKVIVPDMGKPWIVQPIKLRGDLELVFEKGAEVQALRGAFLDPGHSLFSAANVRNLTITGNGATLRMWKADYQKPPYAKAEWRHALNFHGCENVTITGLTLRESGGDGIYLGTGAGGGCRRFVIRDVQCIGNHRQGISVISAEDLLIERCRFDETSGTAPMAGVDFEPNAPGELLKNCVLRGCTFDRNAGAGVLFALGKLDAGSEPISVTLEDCTARGDRSAMIFAMRNPAGARGHVDFTRCTFADSTGDGVVLRAKTLNGPKLTFTGCTFANLATTPKEDAPIVIRSRGEQGDPIGGIRLDDCVIEDGKDRRPIFYDDVGGLRLQDVSGSLTVKHGASSKKIELTRTLLDEWFPWTLEMRAFERRELKLADLVPAFPAAHAHAPPVNAWLRGDAHFALIATKGGSIAFTLATKVIGKKSGDRAMDVECIAPSGKITHLAAAKPGSDADYTLRADEAGVHHLFCRPRQHAVTMKSASVPFSIVAPGGAMHFIGEAGPLSFLVPAGVKEFALRIAGDGDLEQVRAIIADASGKVLADEDNIARTRQILLRRAAAALPEIWSLRLAQPKGAVIEDVQVMFDGVPAVLAPSPESLLVAKGTAALKPPQH